MMDSSYSSKYNTYIYFSDSLSTKLSTIEWLRDCVQCHTVAEMRLELAVGSGTCPFNDYTSNHQTFCLRNPLHSSTLLRTSMVFLKFTGLEIKTEERSS